VNDELDFTDDTDPDVPRGTSEPDPDVPRGTSEPAKRGRPRKAAARKAPAKKAADKSPKMGRPSNDDKLRESIEAQLMALGIGLAGLGVAMQNPALGLDGGSVMDHAEPIAQSLVEVAKQNKKVREYLEKGIEGTAWVGVVIAVGGLAKSIAENHSTPADGAEVAPAASSAFGGLRDAVR